MYFITCFNTDEKYGVGASRCFGYYEDFETADQAVRENWCDMYEYTYSYAVIEFIEAGIHSIAEKENRKTYKWDNTIKGYLPCEEPQEIEHYCNFAIG
jgi:hypothetical protein